MCSKRSARLVAVDEVAKIKAETVGFDRGLEHTASVLVRGYGAFV